jgi:hypothetical protein
MLMPRLFIDLSKDEFDGLRDRAVEDLRHPRDEARFIIRQAICPSDRLPQPDPETQPDEAEADCAVA